MKSNDDKTISKAIRTLNDLIETCKDGENGYRTAAHCVDDPELKMLFQNYEEQRALFAAELQAEVLGLGGDAGRSGTFSGAVSRGWMKIKSAATGEDGYALIGECERDEDVAVKAYQEALQSGLPAGARAVIERQFTLIQKAHDSVRALEKVGIYR